MLRSSALPVPAISNAVPWSTEVRIAPRRQEEQGVGRERTFDVNAAGLAGANGRLDLLGFLTMAEQAVLARMRIDRAHAERERVDPRQERHGGQRGGWGPA